MTNHEKLSEITGETELVEIEALKMLLCRIYDDVVNDLFYQNYDKYLKLYKAQIKWLIAEVTEL